MNKNDLFLAFEDLDDEILERSENVSNQRKAHAFRKWGVLAACMVLTVGLAGAAFAAEAKEYSTAVEFFENNGLSTEGLSRADVKEVYRDITTQSFSSNKTLEVIERAVPGTEISQWEPDSKELEEFWNSNFLINNQPRNKVSYRIDYQERFDEALDFDVFDKGIVSCCRGEEELWSAVFTDFIPYDGVTTTEGTAVWGNTDTWSCEEASFACIARVDDGGNILWQRKLEHGYQHEDIAAVLDNGDGTWAVISNGECDDLCLSRYDTDGNELSFNKISMDSGYSQIQNAVRLGDGYLVQWRDFSEGKADTLIKLDRDWNPIDNFTYEGEDCDYYITDMTQYGEKVYLSAYAVPKQVDEGGRDEIANILDYIYDKNNFEILSEELTPVIRDNYTAMLLKCDIGGGVPEAFYSVKGSLGGEVSVNEAGELVWDVDSVAGASYSPYTSSYSISGVCKVFRYTFDESGALIAQEDTAETSPYLR